MKVCDVLSEARPECEEREQSIRDLAAVLDTPAGFRVCLNLLRSFGIGRQLACNAGEIALYNYGAAFLQDAATASPAQTLNLLRELVFGLAIPLENMA